MANLELFATGNCWQCSECKAKFDALWRPTKKPFVPPHNFAWSIDPPPFKFCPMCGKEIENKRNDF